MGMTRFRTELHVPPAKKQLSVHHPILTTGSCFAEVIGKNLHEHKFTVSVNPFGVTYSPHAIHTQLLHAIQNQPVPDHSFLINNEIHYSYLFHSVLSARSKIELQEQIQQTLARTNHFLSRAKWISITYGTAWAYIRKDTGELVANCHKVPAQFFYKELITQKKMLDSFDSFYSAVKSFNPDITIIVTVSPVRHSKDTMMLNQVSKSVLRLFCHTLTEQYDDVQYFPAYELMMDDLRDYRFYKPDMIHPTTEAEDYIWEKFVGSYCTAETQTFIETWKSIRNDLLHKPFHPNTTAHRTFLTQLLDKLTTLQGTINVDAEIALVTTQLNNT